MKLFHGLNKVLYFDKFTAYFHQPISTTPSFKVAQQFSKGKGLILKLKSGAQHLNDPKKIPKYVRVSWVSCFPNEDEFLCYGAYVVFEISDIIESKDNREHCVELLMLNTFQKTVQNQNPMWENRIKMIEAITYLINKKQNNEEIMEENKYDDKPSKYITEYGAALFNYFCDSPNTTWTCIRNFKALPQQLTNAMFIDDSVEDKKQISLIPITKLFINLKQVVLNELEIQQMTTDCEGYITAVLKYVKYTAQKQNHLEEILIKSKQHRDRKENSTLKKLVN
eukprot:493902_1